MNGKTIACVSAGTVWAIGTALAVDLPELREGLWAVHTQTIGTQIIGGSGNNEKSEATFTLCRSHAYDQGVRASARGMKGCATVSENLMPGKYSSETRCTVPNTNSVVESKGITTFQSDTSTHTESHATYNPPVAGIGERTTIMDQKYVGTCPAGMQPGDRTNPDGSIARISKR